MQLGTVLVFLTTATAACGANLRFASTYTNFMVLQRSPQRAALWGYVSGSDTVQVQLLSSRGVLLQTKAATVSQGKWQTTFDPVDAVTEFTVKAIAKDGTVAQLEHVLFGDVILCSGQSNMAMAISKVFKGAQELAQSSKYNSAMRTLRVPTHTSTTENEDFKTKQIQWLYPAYGMKKFSFSALCYLVGRRVHEYTGKPVGLIDASIGGTPIEAWSRPSIAKTCGSTVVRTRDTHKTSALWNSMISPLKKLSIKMVLWYQGESNAGQVEYGCMMRSMINDWRAEFNLNSQRTTPSDLPFGLVQLAGFGSAGANKIWPRFRWIQTNSYGELPNPTMLNTFMATAMDLPDEQSPFGAIHPRYKDEIAERLFLGVKHIVYGDKNTVFRGPFPSQLSASADQQTVTVTYKHVSKLQLNNKNGFEICCVSVADQRTSTCPFTSGAWRAAPIKSQRNTALDLASGCRAGQRVASVRYAFSGMPCAYLKCPIYDEVSRLPAPVFVLAVPYKE